MLSTVVRGFLPEALRRVNGGDLTELDVAVLDPAEKVAWEESSHSINYE